MLARYLFQWSIDHNCIWSDIHGKFRDVFWLREWPGEVRRKSQCDQASLNHRPSRSYSCLEPGILAFLCILDCRWAQAYPVEDFAKTSTYPRWGGTRLRGHIFSIQKRELVPARGGAEHFHCLGDLLLRSPACSVTCLPLPEEED